MNGEQSRLFPKPSLNVLRDVDSAEALRLARRIVLAIEPMCEKVEIAGSLRRLKAQVNDIDIVVLPRGEMWRSILRVLVAEFHAKAVKQGDKLATYYVPCNDGHVQVDLYRAATNAWGLLLLVRTGSKEHNVYLCNLAISKGMRLLYSQGVVDKDGKVVAGVSEADVFEALGLSFIQPQDREVRTPPGHE